MLETPEQDIIDAEQLRLLRLGFFVSAGTTGFAGLIGLLYVMLGVFFGVMMKHLPAHAGQPPPPEFIAWIFGALGGLFTLVCFTLALLKLRVARCLRLRESHGFCVAISVLTCLGVPYGTALGVFAFLVLTRPSVKALFVR